jgi:integrase
VRRNGLASITFHGLRHSCASMLVNDGFNPKDIQEWLGHSDVRTTMNIYGHLDSTRKKVVGEAISKKVAGFGGC